MIKKLVPCLVLIACNFVFSDVTSSYVLTKVKADHRDELKYVCQLPSSAGKITAKISLNTQTQFLVVDLYEGTQVKGYASSTFDKGTGLTVFFLQGGSEPHFQELTLSLREKGDWAEFRRTYGGESFICQ